MSIPLNLEYRQDFLDENFSTNVETNYNSKDELEALNRFDQILKEERNNIFKNFPTSAIHSDQLFKKNEDNLVNTHHQLRSNKLNFGFWGKDREKLQKVLEERKTLESFILTSSVKMNDKINLLDYESQDDSNISFESKVNFSINNLDLLKSSFTESEIERITAEDLTQEEYDIFLKKDPNVARVVDPPKLKISKIYYSLDKKEEESSDNYVFIRNIFDKVKEKLKHLINIVNDLSIGERNIINDVIFLLPIEYPVDTTVKDKYTFVDTFQYKNFIKDLKDFLLFLFQEFKPLEYSVNFKLNMKELINTTIDKLKFFYDRKLISSEEIKDLLKDLLNITFCLEKNNMWLLKLLFKHKVKISVDRLNFERNNNRSRDFIKLLEKNLEEDSLKYSLSNINNKDTENSNDTGIATSLLRVTTGNENVPDTGNKVKLYIKWNTGSLNVDISRGDTKVVEKNGEYSINITF